MIMGQYRDESMLGSQSGWVGVSMDPGIYSLMGRRRLYAYPLGWSEHFLYLKFLCHSVAALDTPPHSSHMTYLHTLTPHTWLHTLDHSSPWHTSTLSLLAHDTSLHPHSSHMTTSIPSLPTGEASGADSPLPRRKQGHGFLLHQLLPLPWSLHSISWRGCVTPCPNFKFCSVISCFHLNSPPPNCCRKYQGTSPHFLAWCGHLNTLIVEWEVRQLLLCSVEVQSQLLCIVML